MEITFFIGQSPRIFYFWKTSLRDLVFSQCGNLWKKKTLKKKKCFCFLFYAVGVSIWGGPQIGIFIYCFGWCFLRGRAFWPKKINIRNFYKGNREFGPPPDCGLSKYKKKKKILAWWKKTWIKIFFGQRLLFSIYFAMPPGYNKKNIKQQTVLIAAESSIAAVKTFWPAARYLCFHSLSTVWRWLRLLASAKHQDKECAILCILCLGLLATFFVSITVKAKVQIHWFYYFSGTVQLDFVWGREVVGLSGASSLLCVRSQPQLL